MLTAYAQSLKGWNDPVHPVNMPVFSSPMVQVCIASPEAAAQLQQGVQSLGQQSPDQVPLASATQPPPLLMYRPWFFNLRDLTTMLNKAMEQEAHWRAARNRSKRDKRVKTLAQMLTAVMNTKPNPKLGGWSFPGLDGKNKKGGGGSRGGGGLLGGGGRNNGGGASNDTDDGDGEEGGDGEDGGGEDELADDNSSLNDDELMKEYMREMVKDGTAEEMLGAWAASVTSDRADGGKGGQGGIPDRDKQQLNVSSATHAGIVSVITLCFGWSCARAVVGNAWDAALCATLVGRTFMTADTPFAAALDSIQVGSFDGVCTASVASQAARDVGERALSTHRMREPRLRAINADLTTTGQAIEALQGDLERATAAIAAITVEANAIAAAEAATEAAVHDEAMSKQSKAAEKVPKIHHNWLSRHAVNTPDKVRAKAEEHKAVTLAEVERLHAEAGRLLLELEHEMVKRDLSIDEMRGIMEDVAGDALETERFVNGLQCALGGAGGGVGLGGAAGEKGGVTAAPPPLLTHPPLFIADMGSAENIIALAVTSTSAPGLVTRI
jgi:hypothetical protein